MLNLNLTQIIPPSLKALRFILAKDKALFTAWRNKILKDCVFCIRKENNGINLNSDRHEYALVMCECVLYQRNVHLFLFHTLSSAVICRKCVFLKRKKIEGKEIWDDDHDDNGDEIHKCAKKNKQKHRFCVNTFNTPEKCLKKRIMNYRGKLMS